MGNIAEIVAHLMSGGKIAGLNLAQIFAIAGVAKDNEAAIEALIKEAKPLIAKFSDAIKENEKMHFAPSYIGGIQIPGYDAHGQVTAVGSS